MEPGQGISREIGRGEAVEHVLDAFISKRHDQRVVEEGHRPREELWATSERAYFARRDAEMRAAWCEHHQGQAARLRAVLAELINRHEEQAERYRDRPEGAR